MASKLDPIRVVWWATILILIIVALIGFLVIRDPVVGLICGFLSGIILIAKLTRSGFSIRKDSTNWRPSHGTAQSRRAYDRAMNHNYGIPR